MAALLQTERILLSSLELDEPIIKRSYVPGANPPTLREDLPCRTLFLLIENVSDENSQDCYGGKKLHSYIEESHENVLAFQQNLSMILCIRL